MSGETTKQAKRPEIEMIPMRTHKKKKEKKKKNHWSSLRSKGAQP